MSIITVDQNGTNRVQIDGTYFDIEEKNGIIELFSEYAAPRFEEEYSLEGRRVLYFDHLRNSFITLCLGMVNLPVSDRRIDLVRWEGGWYISVDEPFVTKLIKLPKKIRPLVDNLPCIRNSDLDYYWD